MPANTEIKAGPELDAEIARRVFGCRLESAKDLQTGTWRHECGCRYGWHTENGHGLFEYSTDIAAAWLVVEKMREMPKYPDLTWDDFVRNLRPDDLHWYGTAEEFLSAVLMKLTPEKICRAALAALEAR